MAKGYIELNPRKSYNWIDLPQDAIIDKVIVNDSKRLEISYTSKSGKLYHSDGNFGFECYIFREDQNIEVTIAMKNEKRQVIYSEVVELDGEKILIIIANWRAK